MDRIRQISPKRLKPHRANRRVYADGPIDDLLASIRAHGILQPLVATKSMTLISGHRRLKAARKLGLSTVPVIVREVDDELLAIVEFNRSRHKRPSEIFNELMIVLPVLKAGAAGRRRDGARRGGRSTGRQGVTNVGQTLHARRTLDEAATLVGMGRESVRKLLEVFAAHGRHELPAEIVAVLDEGKITINEAHRRLRKARSMRRQQTELREQVRDGSVNLDDLIRPFDVLYFWQRDRRFDAPPTGDAVLESSFGSPPAQLWINLVHFMTDPSDLVIDLTAGSGSVARVCEAMGRRCASFDLVPAAKGIRKHDLRDGLPSIKERPRLIVIDPPFGQQRQFSGNPKDLSACSTAEEFLGIIEKAGAAALDQLGPGGRVAVLMGNSASREFRDFVFELAVRLTRYGRLERRISVPYPPSHFLGGRVADAKRRRRILSLTRELLIFRPLD